MKRLLTFLFALIAVCCAQAQTSQHPLTISLGDIQKIRFLGFAHGHYDLSVDPAGNTANDFNIKRIILMSDAQLTRQLSFWLMVDCASTQANKLLHEYYLQYELLPGLKIRAGQFKQPFTMENIMPLCYLGTLNMNESVRYMAGVAGDPLYGNMAGRDQGVMLTGDVFPAADGHHWLNYSIGIFNGAGLNQRDRNNSKDLVGMVNVSPFKGLKVSSSFIVGQGNAVAASPYSSVAAGSNYTRNRFSSGVEAHWMGLNLRGEMMWGKDADVNSRGGYAELCLRVAPKLDLMFDYDYLNRDISVTRELQKTLPAPTQNANYVVGVQYWFHGDCRLATQYIYTIHNAGPDAQQWVTQLQLAF